MFYVYEILDIVEWKRYFGKTGNPKQRWNAHLRAARKETDKGRCLIHKAIREKGEQNFQFIVLLSFQTEREALNKEVELIATFKTNQNRHGDQFGYNATDGGEGTSGRKCSEETKKKIGQVHRGKKVSVETKRKISEVQKGKRLSASHKRKILEGRIKSGYRHSDETKKKIGQSHKGKHVSVETRQKLSIARKGKSGKPMSDENKRKLIQARTGTKHSEASKQKMSLAHIGKKFAEEALKNMKLAAQKRAANPEIGAKISRALTGIKRSEETKQKCSLARRGEGSATNILMNEQIKEIKSIFRQQPNASPREIGEFYGVAPRTIRDIKNEKTWKHIKEEPTDLARINTFIMQMKGAKSCMLLDATKVQEIKVAIKNGKCNTDLAKLYGVSHSTITDIKAGRTWKRIKI